MFHRLRRLLLAAVVLALPACARLDTRYDPAKPFSDDFSGEYLAAYKETAAVDPLVVLRSISRYDAERTPAEEVCRLRIRIVGSTADVQIGTARYRCTMASNGAFRNAEFQSNQIYEWTFVPFLGHFAVAYKIGIRQLPDGNIAFRIACADPRNLLTGHAREVELVRNGGGG